MEPTKRKIRRTQRLAEKAVPLKEFGEAGPGRGKRVPGKAPTIKTGTNAYWLGRIARDRPDILEAMKRGEYLSVREAVQAAGWRKTPTAVDNMRKLWEKATDQERQAIATEVMGWVLGQDDVVYGAILHEAEKLSEEFSEE